MRSTRSPLGRTWPSTTSPTGSARAATARRPLAIEAMRASDRRSRSTTVEDAPASDERSTSLALASRISSVRSKSRSAAKKSASSLTDEDAVARRRPAALARRPRSKSEIVDIAQGYWATRTEDAPRAGRPARTARPLRPRDPRGQLRPGGTAPRHRAPRPTRARTSSPRPRRRSGPRACRPRPRQPPCVPPSPRSGVSTLGEEGQGDVAYGLHRGQHGVARRGEGLEGRVVEDVEPLCLRLGRGREGGVADGRALAPEPARARPSVIRSRAPGCRCRRPRRGSRGRR